MCIGTCVCLQASGRRCENLCERAAVCVCKFVEIYVLKPVRRAQTWGCYCEVCVCMYRHAGHWEWVQSTNMVHCANRESAQAVKALPTSTKETVQHKDKRLKKHRQ
jgi:hypothetical protein